MSIKRIQKSIVDIYSYDKQLQGIFKKIERDLPKNTVELIYKYDREMINTSKAKGTRRKHL
ncbi:MAG: integrase, partial [Nitrosopumilus sp.]|nr:integrase [Nitrosopumilus sp.]